MRRFRDLSISRKLVVVILTTAIAALMLATAGFTAREVVSFRRSMNARLSSLAGILGASSAGALAFGDPTAAELVVSSVEGQQDIVAACLYIEDGALLAQFQRSAAECPADVEAFGHLDDDILTRLEPVLYEGDRVGFVALFADRGELRANLGQEGQIVLVLLIVTVGVAWGLAVSLQRVISGPVLHLVSVAKSVAERKDYGVRANSHGQDEIGLLSRPFNGMLDQIEADVDHRQQTMARLKESSRDLERASEAAGVATRAKSDFLATMSHEIRTPMNGVVGMAELLAETELTAEQREYTSTIRSSGEALLAIINDILNFSKVEAGKLQIVNADFNLLSALEEVVELLARRAGTNGVELTARRCDGPGGRVRGLRAYSAGADQPAWQRCQVHRGGCGVRARDARGGAGRHRGSTPAVSDTGIGISDKALGRLFQPFSQADSSTTRRFGGTGLGLAISKQLVELMGGTIGAHSVEGKGSTFWFTVPFKKRAILPAEPLVDGVALAGLRALTVDDNATDLLVLEKSLRAHGLVVDTKSDPTCALARFRRAAERDQPYDLVLLDLVMPELDGIELGRRIQTDRRITGAHSSSSPRQATTA